MLIKLNPFLPLKPDKVYFWKMNIAITVNCLYKNDFFQEKWFIETLLTVLLKKKEKHKLIIISDKETGINFPALSNFEKINIGSPGNSILQKRYWLDIKLPLCLKKKKADILISFDNYYSKQIAIPQILFFFDGRQLESGCLKKAKMILLNSEWELGAVLQKHKSANKKFATIHAAIKEIYKPVEEKEKEKTKANYSSGKEYFLCPGNHPDQVSFIGLLKSFSHFKKRMQSGMKLLLLCQPGKKSMESLSSYKYREDVSIIENSNEETKALLIASAYAVLVYQQDRKVVFYSLNALQSRVPLLAKEDSPVKEYAGEAALYFTENTSKELGEKMIQVYTDEKLRNHLSKTGLEKAKKYTIINSANQLWDFIQQAVN